MYFNSLEGVGALDIYYVFYGDEHPVLFLCQDYEEHKYLCQCYEYRGVQKWHVKRISESTLIDLLDGHISVLDVYKQKDFPIHDVTYTVEKIETDCIVELQDIEEVDLPDDMYLEDEDKEDYFSFFAECTNEIISGYVYMNTEDIPISQTCSFTNSQPFIGSLGFTLQDSVQMTYDIREENIALEVSGEIAYAA